MLVIPSLLFEFGHAAAPGRLRADPTSPAGLRLDTSWVAATVSESAARRKGDGLVGESGIGGTELCDDVCMGIDSCDFRPQVRR